MSDDNLVDHLFRHLALSLHFSQQSCLKVKTFSAVAFQLRNRLPGERKDSSLNQHLRIIGIEKEQFILQSIAQKLREHAVTEFLGSVEKNMPFIHIIRTVTSLTSWLITSLTGISDCELRNATPLALARIRGAPFMMISSI